MDAKEITDALATVKDSYFNKDIITLGYVKGMSIGADNLRFSLRLPAPLMRDHDELAQKCKIALKDIEGIKNIEIIRKDTYTCKNNFFSSRRSKKNNHDYGRNISLIMIK